VVVRWFCSEIELVPHPSLKVSLVAQDELDYSTRLTPSCPSQTISKPLLRRSQEKQRDQQVMTQLISISWNAGSFDFSAEAGRISNSPKPEPTTKTTFHLFSIQNMGFTAVSFPFSKRSQALPSENFSPGTRTAVSERLLRQIQGMKSQVINVLSESSTFSVAAL
jgi:hypothetical protein